MEDLRDDLGPKAQGIVLDLRNNPGGLLDQSIAVADSFLDDGVVVSVRGRDPADNRAFGASSGDAAEGLPMVVLVNGGSASAAEIVAAALQDHDRATVLGSNSFGKGSVQTVMRLPVEGALKLTTALYYAPSGETIQARGVEPDITLNVKVDDDRKQLREADLPGALPERGEGNHAPRAELDAAACPAVGEKGKEDHELGCAIAFLEAGSTARFLASVGGASRHLVIAPPRGRLPCGGGPRAAAAQAVPSHSSPRSTVGLRPAPPVPYTGTTAAVHGAVQARSHGHQFLAARRHGSGGFVPAVVVRGHQPHNKCIQRKRLSALR